jgi:hypothetical protein
MKRGRPGCRFRWKHRWHIRHTLARLDYSNDNQGSDLVVLTNLTPDGFKPMSLSAWDALVR